MITAESLFNLLQDLNNVTVRIEAQLAKIPPERTYERAVARVAAVKINAAHGELIRLQCALEKAEDQGARRESAARRSRKAMASAA